MSTEDTPQTRAVSRLANRVALAFACVFPTVVTLAYFVWLADSPSSFQQGCYMVGKVIQFGFPAVWVFLIHRRRFARMKLQKDGLGLGILFGVAVGLAMFGLYHLWMKPAGLLTAMEQEVQTKVAGMGVDTVPRFALLGVFYALCHSLMEEYYWRWFVFRELQRETTLLPSVMISSFGFMAHHVILLGTYFQWALIPTSFFSFSVAVGGMFWAWLYHKTGSLTAPWMSHLIVDAAIFLLGYQMVFGGS